MKKRIINFIILFVLILFLIVVNYLKIDCIFNNFIGINCPSCGMTRAFSHIISFEFIDAFLSNILSIPLFIFIVFFIINLIIDFFKNRFIFIPKFLSFLEKYYIIIVILIILSFLYNNLFNKLI